MAAPVTLDELHARFVARVRELAKDKGLALEAVADAGDLSHGHLWNVLQGRYRPTLKTMVKIAAGLGVDPHELIRPPEPRRRSR
jgi:transcriptional regulator with XRE-family HTH domain